MLDDLAAQFTRAGLIVKCDMIKLRTTYLDVEIELELDPDTGFYHWRDVNGGYMTKRRVRGLHRRLAQALPNWTLDPDDVNAADQFSR